MRGVLAHAPRGVGGRGPGDRAAAVPRVPPEVGVHYSALVTVSFDAPATFASTMTAGHRQLGSGEILFHEGDHGEDMFVVQSGRIRITKAVGGEERVLAEMTPGEFFGEMAILNHEPRNATAVATEPTVVLVYDKGAFEQMLIGNPGIAVRMVYKLAARLQRTNEMLH